MPHRARLLGFAFTNADVLFEVDEQGVILFAAGAANDLVRESDETLLGKPAGKLFKPSEGIKFATFAKALKAGDRAGPYKLTLATGAEANLAMFRLPDNGANISCTLARPGPRSPSTRTDPKTGLARHDEFLAAAEKAGNKDALTLVNVPGLPDLCASLSLDHADALMRRIGASLQTSGATATGRVSDTGFGALAPATRGSLDLARKVTEAFTAGGLAPPPVAEIRLALQGPGLSPEQRILSLRYVIDRFAEKGRIEAGDGDIGSAFAHMMEETQMRLAAMSRTVGEGAFDIAYQPIADLASGKVSHYEALARFTNPEGTGETVKFIEALGIANSFDLAVANKVLGLIEQHPDAHIAFNVSGETIASPASFGMLAAILARRRKLAPRTLIEITETAAIVDLESAGKAIQVLREMGYRVGLDDFGAGAASFGYLKTLRVDTLKIDGQFVRDLVDDPLDEVAVRCFADVAKVMGLTTVAEFVDKPAVLERLHAMDVDFAQGYLLHEPAPIGELIGEVAETSTPA